MDWLTQAAIGYVERGYVPDALVRAGVRHLIRARARALRPDNFETAMDAKARFLEEMGQSPIALVPEKANEQHYEVPAQFFELTLGKQRKYSCCYWPDGHASLDEAEAKALSITADRVGVEDGMDILELGCGWGSLTLWMAEHLPNSSIHAVSNSKSQQRFITARARRLGLGNVQVQVSDMNDFDTDDQFDRVVSVEMFEHMRNHALLFERIHSWLKPGGRFFLHIFVHRDTPYPFVETGPSNWMTRHFFSGGLMPSDDLPLYFQKDLHLMNRWRWSGKHYEKTANAWLLNMDQHRDRIYPILVDAYGAELAPLWWMRWRLFFMACAELFGYENGREWWVSHYLFERPRAAGPRDKHAVQGSGAEAVNLRPFQTTDLGNRARKEESSDALRDHGGANRHG